ncbi:PREDICTED: uncharacterized protein LOC105966430 [Erythranthe guttata]|uniref:uncharacterized protein LOC105966430 n=1 Tax=Erythranthe guttata TaxID=4155 RepID=UPI00064DE87E|nr:PREDICTED: uncharacterized protein LOC105966430 [Erythranthe guttata]|eukprot:XP_012846436.1 PREDICTED: uncharacterized protein LOC105966430 [Erythranthe guttata]
MAPLIPCTTTNSISPTSGVAFTINRRSNCYLSRFNITIKLNRQTLQAQKYTLPLSKSVGLQTFSQIRIGSVFYVHSVGAATDAEGTSGGSFKRSRYVRKSEMPPVNNEDLIPGATFTGKVRSIQPFGAFIDFGSFTDGLVHVSNLSNEFVKDVGSIVSVGQEVVVRLIEANMETRRISLSMRNVMTSANDEEDFDENLIQQGVVHTATNPFVLAFRTNKVISAFLDELEKEKQNEHDLLVADISDKIVAQVKENAVDEKLVKGEEQSRHHSSI